MLFIPALFFSTIQKKYKITFVTATLLFLFFDPSILNSNYILNSAQTDDGRYNLVFHNAIGDSSSSCLLYKCNTNNIGCAEIPSYDGYCTWGLENSKLVVNPTSNEVNVFLDTIPSDGFRLDFTYGSQPRSYMDEIEWADYDYYLAYFYDKSQSMFKYMLYKCNKDTVECSRLPFRYDTQDFQYGNLELDETTNEIKILIGKKLIYTYGNSPRCYVDGCFLTDK